MDLRCRRGRAKCLEDGRGHSDSLLLDVDGFLHTRNARLYLKQALILPTYFRVVESDLHSRVCGGDVGEGNPRYPEASAVQKSEVDAVRNVLHNWILIGSNAYDEYTFVPWLEKNVYRRTVELSRICIQ